jgi:ribosomal protein S18 acetylase RimI-like enzyme
VTGLRVSPADGSRRAAEFANLRAGHADELDPYSTLERVPSAADLAGAFDTGLPALVASPAVDDTPLGYGVVHAWVEGDGTEVRLLDVWAVPGDRRSEVEEALLMALEAAVRERADPSSQIMLGANSRDTEPARTELLGRLGYRPTFDMVELELTDRAPRTLLPAGTTLREAAPGDADQVAALLGRVWAGRPYFTPPEPAEVRRWLGETDPELYLLAEDDAGPIGLASAVIEDGRAELDDLGVDPGAHGRGIGSGLVSELLDRLERRGASPVRLHTEGHDPAGALRLYLRQGFTIVGRSHRFRKQLWPRV